MSFLLKDLSAPAPQRRGFGGAAQLRCATAPLKAATVILRASGGFGEEMIAAGIQIKPEGAAGEGRQISVYCPFLAFFGVLGGARIQGASGQQLST